MTPIIDSIPANLDTGFLPETESLTPPAIRQEGNRIVFPALVRQDIRAGKTVYRYFEVPVRYSGQDIADYDQCRLRSYADLRKHFYGPPEVQMEQLLKGTFAAHQWAVRAAFPKYDGETIPAEERFAAIKAAFWHLVDQAGAACGKTRDDLPATFNAEDMTAWAEANGMSRADIADYTGKFAVISLNLLQNGRNWAELF